jgi:uncharacterized protein YegP (UPF0339 family)
MQNPKFSIFKSAVNNQYYYRLRAGNGEIILSGEGYISKQSCQTAIASVKVNAPFEARYERKNLYSFTFMLKAANSETIGKSESYTTTVAREGGIAAVKRDAPYAPVEDLT